MKIDNNFIARLIRSSAEVDRKRKEILQVTTLLLGFLPPGPPKGEAYGIMLWDGGDIRWHLAGSAGSNEIYCEVSVGKTDHLQKMRMCFSTKGKEIISVENVNKVHEALPVLVAGLLEVFPGLSEKWQPLLDTA